MSWRGITKGTEVLIFSFLVPSPFCLRCTGEYPITSNDDTELLVIERSSRNVQLERSREYVTFPLFPGGDYIHHHSLLSEFPIVTSGRFACKEEGSSHKSRLSTPIPKFVTHEQEHCRNNQILFLLRTHWQMDVDQS